MNFEGVNDSKRLLDPSQYFDIVESEKIKAILPRSLKKSFNNVIIIPTKMRRCNECKDGMLCTTCINPVIENQDFEANLNLLK